MGVRSSPVSMVASGTPPSSCWRSMVWFTDGEEGLQSYHRTEMSAYDMVGP